MKLLFIGLFTLILATPSMAQKIFSTGWKAEADVKVFVTKVEQEADLVVYVTNWQGDLNKNNGYWHYTQVRSEADKKIFIQPKADGADLIIFYTNNRKNAGWRNKSKVPLLAN